MTTLIFIIGFVLLAIFIPQAICGYNWQDLIKMVQNTDDKWVKEIAQVLNRDYTTISQYAIQQILICVGILIAYIIIAAIIKKIISK